MGNDLMDARLDKLLIVSERSLQTVTALSTKVEDVERRVDSVETQLDRYAMIHSGQAKKLRQAANRRVRELLGADNYATMRSQYYSWLWNAYQDAFGVTSYTDTRLRHFEAALDWIKEWQPIRSVSMEELREKTMQKAAH